VRKIPLHLEDMLSRDDLIPTRWSLFLILLLAATGLYACVCDLALIWDGGAHFCYTLVNGEAYAYQGRFFSAILWQPVVWAAGAHQELSVLRFLFGFPLCLAPAIGLALSCWMGRSRPELLLWALPGICVSAIPSQVFMINESTFQQTLFWPVMLGLLVPLTIPRRIMMALLLVFQFSHPQGLLLMAVAALLLWLLGRNPRLADSEMYRRRVKYMVGLCVLCLMKIVLTPDPYAVQEAGIWPVLALFYQGLLGWPLLGWLCLVGAFGLSLRNREGDTRRVLILVLLAGVVLIYWAVDPTRWVKALDARRFALPLALPFYVGLWFTIRKPARPAPCLRNVAFVSVILFCVVLTIQSARWNRQLGKVLWQVEADPRSVLPVEEFTALQGTPLDHWGLGPQIIARLGGRKLLLDENGRNALMSDPPQVTVGYDALVSPEPGPLGWFDFHDVVRKSQEHSSETPSLSE